MTYVRKSIMDPCLQCYLPPNTVCPHLQALRPETITIELEIPLNETGDEYHTREQLVQLLTEKAAGKVREAIDARWAKSDPAQT